jgi:hypothetical protein
LCESIPTDFVGCAAAYGRSDNRNRTQAQEFVWGVDDSQLRFVQKYMGTTPERVIITAEQRQEAIDAARGRPSTKEGQTAG